jgi:hypothetical protein
MISGTLTASIFEDILDTLKYATGGYVPNRAGKSVTANALAQAAMVKKPEPSLLAMIGSRMRWDPEAMLPFDVIAPHRINEEQVAVFIVVSGRALIIHDDANLFPSDTLVTQLRLLEK